MNFLYGDIQDDVLDDMLHGISDDNISAKARDSFPHQCPTPNASRVPAKKAHPLVEICRKQFYANVTFGRLLPRFLVVDVIAPMARIPENFPFLEIFSALCFLESS